MESEPSWHIVAMVMVFLGTMEGWMGAITILFAVAVSMRVAWCWAR